MRVGLVSPYSFDVPGGVQLHVRDLAEYLLNDGHEVSVLAPAEQEDNLPPYVVSVGRSVPVRYNGSVARLAFGPVTAARVSRWLDRGNFDILHVHEPVSPSVSMLALWAFEGPVVATFHTSNVRSRAMIAANPLLRPGMEKITGRIAVSQDARDTVVHHMGGDAVIIPNGVYVQDFQRARVIPEWQGQPNRPTIVFLGRMNEPRKGLPVLLDAMRDVLRRLPGARLLVAGPGDFDELSRAAAPEVTAALEYLGEVSDQDKASLLRSADVYVAPNTGGESFGIILVEAMSAGIPVIASDLSAFRRVLDGGGAGALFKNEDSHDLAQVLLGLLRDPRERARLSAAGLRRSDHFDWSRVAARITTVYETVIEAYEPAPNWPRTLRRGGN